MFYIISRRIHYIFFCIYLCAKSNTRTIWVHTPSSHVCIIPFFFSIESKWRKEAFYSLVVCKCAYERMKCDFLHRLCAQCRYTDMDVDTHTHTQYVIYKIWLQLLFWLQFVCRLLIFLQNGCGWFDSHLLLSVDNIPATGYNGSVILGKLQLLRIIRAAILIAAFYSYTKRCDAHTQQKNGR